MTAFVTWPRTAISVKPGNSETPAMRQLNDPRTDPSSLLVRLNPNCENAVVPSTVPWPPPFATLGPAASEDGARTSAATTSMSSDFIC
jgi:hypothetical protein